MSKQLVTYVWCDNHPDDEQVPATTVRITLGNQVPRELDLCDVCRKELIDPLQTLLAEQGQPVEPTGPDGRLACTVTGCTKTYGSERALRRHLESHDAAEGASVELLPCPECGKQCSSPAGLGSHRWRAHGVEGVSGK